MPDISCQQFRRQTGKRKFPPEIVPRRTPPPPPPPRYQERLESVSGGDKPAGGRWGRTGQRRLAGPITASPLPPSFRRKHMVYPSCQGLA